MTQFVMMCVDRPGALALRQATREAHLAYVGAHREAVRVAGPMLDDDGRMCGSMFVMEVADIQGVRDFNAQDPYTLAGLFDRVEIFAWRQTVGAPI